MIRPSQRFFANANLDPRLRAGLVGHWIGGGSGRTWSDRSGKNNHGSLSTAERWTLGEGGKRSAIQTDGTGYVTVPNSASIATTGDISVSLWIKSSDAAQSDKGIISKWGAPAYPWLLWQLYGNVIFETAGSFNAVQWVGGAASLCDGQWHRLSVTLRGTAGTMYFDGAVVATGTPSAVPAGTPDLFIGSYSGRNFTGAFEDVRIYDRALSGAEIGLLSQPSFLPVVPRRWFVGPGSTITTDATAAHSTWVAPAATAVRRFTAAATAAFSTWTVPAATARTSYTVTASAALSTWVAPSASAQLARRRSINIPCSVASYSIPTSSTSYQIEVS